ncbi:hypothetical protein T484DRAFT_1940997 [Baffinella frigidus]|nr:hypothetical protein T484DRAFT_1940997 [Cryptophyta sp. CCMP2293]|mmetsp:Transcript_14885/g.35988  ORF Transcript_14885/g.35988 Transcript_14885/m.35988 type:complete len:243 (-) Transcript_14885:45-773(-)
MTNSHRRVDPGLWEAPARERAVGHASMTRARLFPSPLDAETVRLALEELEDGHRKSTVACVKHWKDWKMSDDHLVLSMLSLCGQSSVLRHAFRKTHRKHSDQEEESVASEDDMFLLRSLSVGSTPFTSSPTPHSLRTSASRDGAEHTPPPMMRARSEGVVGGGSVGREAAVPLREAAAPFKDASKKVRMQDDAAARLEGFCDVCVRTGGVAGAYLACKRSEEDLFVPPAEMDVEEHAPSLQG